MYRSAEPRAADAARMICRSLDAFFRSDCSREYGVDVDVADVDVTACSDEAPCTIRLGTTGDRSVQAHFVVCHVGGNVYDVRGGLAGGTTRQFTCCLPDTDGTPTAPSVGRSIGGFLVDELQRSLGRRALCRADETDRREADRELDAREAARREGSRPLTDPRTADRRVRSSTSEPRA